MNSTALESALFSLCITPRPSLSSPSIAAAPDSAISVQTADRFIPVRSRMQCTLLESPDYHHAHVRAIHYARVPPHLMISSQLRHTAQRWMAAVQEQVTPYAAALKQQLLSDVNAHKASALTATHNTHAGCAISTADACV